MLHVADEIGVRDHGVLVHAIVRDVLARIVWVSRDDVILDAPYHRDDPRLEPWVTP